MRRLRLLVAGFGIAAVAPVTVLGADPLVAPGATCPGQRAAKAAPDQQEGAMRCLVRWARDHAGVAAGADAASLNRSAQTKANLIARCGILTHTACGTPWNAAIQSAGFRGLYFENLAAGSGRFATPRAALEMWLRSSGHRRALLDQRVTVFGVGMRRGVRVNGWRGSVWVLHLGRPE